MTHRECPKCSSTSISDSRQRKYELPLSLLCLKPYRCVSCEARFFGFSDRQSRKILPLLKYAVGFLICFGVIWVAIVTAVRIR